MFHSMHAAIFAERAESRAAEGCFAYGGGETGSSGRRRRTKFPNAGEARLRRGSREALRTVQGRLAAASRHVCRLRKDSRRDESARDENETNRTCLRKIHPNFWLSRVYQATVEYAFIG